MVQEGWGTVPVKANELKKHETKKTNWKKRKESNHDVAEESNDKRGESVPAHENAAQN